MNMKPPSFSRLSMFVTDWKMVSLETQSNTSSIISPSDEIGRSTKYGGLSKLGLNAADIANNIAEIGPLFGDKGPNKFSICTTKIKLELFKFASEIGPLWDDKELNIDWCIPKNQLKLAEKDLNNPTLVELESYFDYAANYYDK